MNSHAVSVKDVAARAGVSLGTVSNVLNHPERVRADTRERVEKAVEDLGFVRNESARQLRAGHSRVLAYLVPSTDNAFFTDVARGARQEARDRNLALFLCSSDDRTSYEVDHLRLLVQQRVQGVLLTPLRKVPAKELQVLRRQGIGVVLVDRPAAGNPYCSVSVDDVVGGRLAVAHLIAQGHRRIAFVGDPATHAQVADRLAGAREAMAEAGLDADRLRVVATPEMSIDSGWAAGPEIGQGTARTRVTAAFCANDLLAIGLLQYAVSQGMRVPRDLALVGYDDIEFAAGAAVPLSSVRQPRDELGRTAVRLLITESEEFGGGGATADQHRHQHVVFTPELVVRASSGTA